MNENMTISEHVLLAFLIQSPWIMYYYTCAMNICLGYFAGKYACIENAKRFYIIYGIRRLYCLGTVQPSNKPINYLFNIFSSDNVYILVSDDIPACKTLQSFVPVGVAFFEKKCLVSK